MLRLWRASTIQKAVKHTTARLPNSALIILRRSSPWNGNLHRLDGLFVATGHATHTTLSPKSEPALSDAQRRTIYALSTPPGKAGIAVVRVSGPDALDVWRRMTRKPKSGDRPTPWLLQRRDVVDPETGEKLDDGLTVFFKGEFCLFALGTQYLLENYRPQIIYYGGYTGAPYPLWARSTFCTATCACKTPIL